MTSTQVRQASSASEQRTVVAVGTATIVLGAAVLVSGLANLAIASAMAELKVAPDFPVPLSSLPASIAVAVLVTQNWPAWVAVQLTIAAIVLAGGIGFLRRRSWARVAIQGLAWIGLASLAVPVVWIARWVLMTPADRILGLRTGLQTLPSGVGQPVATVVQLFLELGWWSLGRLGLVDLTAPPQTIFGWTAAGVFFGTVATSGIPAAAVGLLVLLGGPRMREVFRRGAA